MTDVQATLREINGRGEWFHDPDRPDSHNVGPHLIVIDDFYPDPHAIRELALQQEFHHFAPPLASQVGDEVARIYAKQGTLKSTAVVVFGGQKVNHPIYGFRHNPPEVAQLMAKHLGEEIEHDTWEHGGDYWNGAFHLTDEDFEMKATHTHYKAGDVEPYGWSGVLFLSPDAPRRAGTSIWRSLVTGQCISQYGAFFDPDMSKFEMAFLAENRFNRLVLFRENILHRAERGFGTGTDARLTQTFFFRTRPRAA
ncbi:MAG: hypothetical protein ABI867_14340 [Kofleriaceae bacterium]